LERGHVSLEEMLVHALDFGVLVKLLQNLNVRDGSLFYLLDILARSEREEVISPHTMSSLPRLLLFKFEVRLLKVNIVLRKHALAEEVFILGDLGAIGGIEARIRDSEHAIVRPWTVLRILRSGRMPIDSTTFVLAHVCVIVVEIELLCELYLRYFSRFLIKVFIPGGRTVLANVLSV